MRTGRAGRLRFRLKIRRAAKIRLLLTAAIVRMYPTMKKSISHIIDAIPFVEIKGPENVMVTSLAYDSRKVERGSLFFALPGIHENGATFIPHAIKNGAAAIVHRDPLPAYEYGVCYIRVGNPRFAMSAAAAAFYDDPSKNLRVVGVTGTEGKSSTVSFIFQLLRLSGKKAGFISTVDFCTKNDVMPNPEHQTTPEAVEVHKHLADMRDNGIEYAVIEASSHGLSPRTNRLGDVLFDVAVMTNVTHEHLEFHGTHEQYKSDKANLFRALDTHPHIKNGVETPSFGVVNEDDPAAGYFHAATSKPVFGCSTIAAVPRGGLSATGITETPDGISFYLGNSSDENFHVKVPLKGAFNARNIMSALVTVSHLTDAPLKTLIPLLDKLRPVRGRMTKIEKGQPFEVIVDYAHTPSSFQTIFPPLRGRIKGKIISLFGSGGERDTMKRPEQGRIASDYSDIVFLTDEDPRGEDSFSILEDIASGCAGKTRGENLFLIPDRPQAIRRAFSMAGEGDLVLLLGKGHENSIIYKNTTMPYDEIGEAEKALAETGYT